jgi:hypothetical protein
MRLVPVIVSIVAAVIGSMSLGRPAYSQAATVQVRPADSIIPPDVIYPDAIACNVTSPDNIDYRIIFYKSQTASFPHEPNNVAEYGTPFLRDPDKFDPSIPYKWRLQLGQPGNVTIFTLPPRWTTANCGVGKSIAELIADKQALKIFTPLTPDR